MITAAAIAMLVVLTLILAFGSHGSDNRVRVACIGDSLTGDTDYPGYLQTLLGSEFRVENFGVTSSTVQTDTFKPYLQQFAFIIARNFRPSIAVIMLGTNDARNDHAQSLENFVSDYTQLVAKVLEIETNPQVFLVKPPPVFQNEIEINGTAFSSEILPLIDQTARELNLPIIDVYSALESHPEYFVDGVHPTSEGVTIIATEVYEVIIGHTLPP